MAKNIKKDTKSGKNHLENHAKSGKNIDGIDVL